MNTPVLSSPLQSVALEKEKRLRRTTRLKVISVKPRTRAEAALTPPGTITVIVARKGSGDLRALSRAVEKGGGEIEAFLSVLLKDFKKYSPTAKQYAADLVAEPVFAELRYGGATVDSDLFVPPGHEYTASRFPYNGGRLSPEGFTFAEYLAPGADAALEAVVFRADPPLTAAEKAALKLVPASQTAGNVGAHPMEFCKWWTFIASAAIFVGAATWHVACTVILLARTTHLSKKELDRLGPTASARELLALRRDVFERATRKKRG